MGWHANYLRGHKPHPHRSAQSAYRATRFWLGLGLLICIIPRTLHAGSKTYCVGGFEFDYGVATRQQCKLHGDIHSEWHFHNHVRGPDGKCRECWDEQDQTCETRFLNDHPEFTAIPDYLECLRRGALPPTGEEIRVENGEVIKVKPAPPPAAVDLRAEILHLSAGPYAAGDKVMVDARVRGPDGQPRSVQGGEIVLKGADGTEKLRVPVHPVAGGVAAEVTIPAGGNLSLSFVPRGITLSANERVGAVQPEAVALSVSPCRLRGTVLLPRDGEIVTADTALLLSGQVRNNSGAPVDAATLSAGTRVVFVIERASGKTQEVAAQVNPAGVATASVQLTDPTGDSESMAVRLLGREGGGDFCPAAPATLQLTRLGVGIEVVAPLADASCYVGRPCRLAMRFRLPTGTATRAIATAFVQDPGLQVTAALNGEPVGPLLPTRAADGQTEYVTTFEPRFARPSELVITARALGHQVQARVPRRIRLPLSLKLPGVLDFGVLTAGTARLDNCQTLDFSASIGIEEQPLRLQAQVASPCRSTLYIVDGSGHFFGLAQPRSVTISLDRTVRICLAVPRCAGDSPAKAQLTVQAQSADFPSAQAAVQVRWQVTARSFLSCHLWWIALVGGVLLLAFIAYGFLRPSHFSADDSVKIATKQPALQRAVARRLRDLPGGRAGFYRSAATGLREDGSATGRKRQALLRLAAVHGDIVLYSRGPVQRYNPQTRKLDNIPIGKHGYSVTKNAVYCAGALYFQVT